MPKTLARRMFQPRAMSYYQNGGIVSTVQDVLPPTEVAPQDIMGATGGAPQDPMAGLQMAEAQIDAAQTPDEVFSASTGTSTEQARADLAGVVGPQDAAATPESVLLLVQPTMQLLALSEGMAGQGGITNLPMPLGESLPPEGGMSPLPPALTGAIGDPTNPLAAPTMEVPAGDFNPVAGFQLGNLVDATALNPLYSGTDPNQFALSGLTDPTNNPLLGPLPQFRGAVPSPMTPLPEHQGIVSTETAQLEEGPQDYPYPNVYFQGLTPNIHVPTISATERLAQRYMDWSKKYGPPEPDLKDITQERKTLLGDYLEPEVTLEQIQAEQAEDYGDIEKDLRVQAWLDLATAGATIANSRGTVFQAIAEATPGLANDLSEAVATKRALERERNQLARGQFTAAERARREQEMQIAVDSLNVYENRLTGYQDQIQQAAQLGYSWGYEYDKNKVADMNAHNRLMTEIAAELSMQPSLFYVNKKTGDQRTGNKVMNGTFDLDGNYLGKDWIQVDFDDWYTSSGKAPSGTMHNQTLTVMDPSNINAFYELEAFYDDVGVWWTNDPETGAVVPLWPELQGKGLTWVKGDVGDVLKQTILETGDKFATWQRGPWVNTTTPITLSSNAPKLTNQQKTDANGQPITEPVLNIDGTPMLDDNGQQIMQPVMEEETFWNGQENVTVLEPLTVNPNSVYSISPDNVLAYQVGTKDSPAFTLPWQGMQESVKAIVINDIRQTEQVVRSMLEMLGTLATPEGAAMITGPMARLRFMSNTAGAFIHGMPEFADEAAFARAHAFMMEDLVVAEVPSTRLPVRQVEYVRDNLADLPNQFSQNPRIAWATMQEILRISQNQLAAMQGQITGEPYLQIPQGLPLGMSKETAWDWGNEKYRNFIMSQQNAEYDSVKAGMVGQHVFIPLSTMDTVPDNVLIEDKYGHGRGVYTTFGALWDRIDDQRAAQSAP